MTRRLVGAAGLWVLACTVVLASDFWETKPFTDWSDKELQQLMSDSPWSRRVNVVNVVPSAPGRGGGLGESEAFGGAGGGGRVGGGAGTVLGGEPAETAARGAGGGGRAAGPATPQQLKLTVSWRSSLPMKQALVRSQVGIDRPIPPDSQLLLERREEFYIVSVSGLPLSYSRATGTLKTETFLQREHNAPISPSSTIIQPVKDTLMLVFAFPRTDAITLKDKDVEFVTKLGQIEIKKKFNLKSMVFHGELEL